MSSNNTYYVYAYLRSKDSETAKAGTPYYIGKGVGQRAFVKHHHRLPKHKEQIIFLKRSITEEYAINLEKSLIAWYGRKDLGTGILNNRTDGGEGASNPSAETRNKMSFAKRNETAETRLKRSLAAKNRVRTPCSEETKQRISNANTGKARTDEAKEKQAARKRGKTWEEIFGIEGAAIRREDHRIRREQRNKIKEN